MVGLESAESIYQLGQLLSDLEDYWYHVICHAVDMHLSLITKINGNKRKLKDLN